MASGRADIPVPPEEAFELVKRNVSALRWTLVHEDIKTGVVRARTPATLRSWGEEVRFAITGKTEGSTVYVESNPAAQVFDWGKSGENVNTVIRKLLESG